VRWSPFLVLAALLVGASACSRVAAVEQASPPSPQPGVILGVFGEQQDRGDPVKGVSGIRIGAYDQAFLPGTLVASPPTPLTQTVTGFGGRFRIAGLPPGRYFVAAINAAGVSTGAWVDLSADRGASLMLTSCLRCPPPA
jgi:hypothetical protein